MDKPKDWWGDPANAQKWIDQVKRHNNDSDYYDQPQIVVDEVNKRKKDFKSILEVGAGTGHLIGTLSLDNDFECASIDINSKLSEYVKTHYNVLTFVGDIIDLPFKDNHFDLVFTYQVLQHVPPENIKKALSELQRIAKKEVWMWEGIGRIDGYKQGDMTHKAHNGSWVWYIDKMVDCYETKIPGTGNKRLERIKL